MEPYSFLLLYLVGLVNSISINHKEDTSSGTTIEDNPQGVRCFCNLPACISTGYLCKSNGLGCFSDLIAYQEIDKAVHGCLDLLPRERQSSCQNNPGKVASSLEGTLLLCCQEDVCNHVDSPEARVKYNKTLIAVRSRLRLDRERLEGQLDYGQQEAWFRAATVAVPICGALILLILIIMAVKILRADSQDHQPKFRGMSGGGRTLIVTGNNPHMDTGAKKLPLLYQHNETGTGVRLEKQEKNEAQAKLNLPSELLDLSKSCQKHSNPCNLYQPLLTDNNLYSKAYLMDWASPISRTT